MNTNAEIADLIDIGEVTDRSGLAASALRFYEREGLIKSVARSGLRRQYAPEVLQRLAAISLARLSGFTIAEIRLLFATNGTPEEWKPLAAVKVEELSAQIERLEFLRTNLQHALGCKSPNIWSCKYFQHALATAHEDGGPRRTPEDPPAPASLSTTTRLRQQRK
jgi:DNA-binding transcriptional MerR regulator